MNAENAKHFFEEYTGSTASEWSRLAQSGSARTNFLAAAGNKKYIVTCNDNIRENESFLYYSQLFSELELNTPEIFCVAANRKAYIQEFLGSSTLSEKIAAEGTSENVKRLIRQALEKLYRLQVSTRDKTDFSRAFEYETYNELPILHDLYYFKNFTADVLDLDYHKSSLLKEFKKIVGRIESLEPKGIMIRDFQARNIMVDDEDKVSFIDYQSAMEGPLMYDAVSLLFQAKANFPESFTEEMLDFYTGLFPGSETRHQLKNSVNLLKMMRFLQVLGAYGFRGLIQRKPHFTGSLKKGIENISALADNWQGMKEYPELAKVIRQLASPKTEDKIKEILSL